MNEKQAIEGTKKWYGNGKNFRLVDTGGLQETGLALGVYQAQESMTGFGLEKVHEEFQLPSGFIDLERKFVDRVKGAWEVTDRNLGVILVGQKGSGKSVTMMQLANEIEQPVVMFTSFSFGIPGFLADIPEDVTVVFDEAEKIFRGRYDSMLPVMDGALMGGGRKLFLLTMNELRVSRYLINRPGRVRYVKKFQGVPGPVLEQLVTDGLKNQEHVGQVLGFLRKDPNVSLDVAREVVKECNLYGELPKEFEGVLNVGRPEEGLRMED